MQKEIKTTLAAKQLLQLCVLPSEGSGKVSLSSEATQLNMNHRSTHRKDILINIMTYFAGKSNLLF